MQIFDVQSDHVIKSAVATGRTTYQDAIEKFVPLIDRFDEQRKLQRPKFYERLKGDIVDGCIMPPITLAFVHDDVQSIDTVEKALQFLNENIQEGYILDGMQRLNTLKAASEYDNFCATRPIYMNVIIASKYDLLLYRMITLNNGQRPMTVRHQVEMLTGNLLKKLLADQALKSIDIISEKDTQLTSPRGAFKLSDISAAYLAFLTDSAHNQNARFIEEKLDEILVGKVMASGAIESDVSFQDIISEVDRFSTQPPARDWLRNENNLIGFTLGYKVNHMNVKQLTPEEFSELSDDFDRAFTAINPSKVNVGKFRRELSLEFIKIAHEKPTLEALTEMFFDLTAA
ncbi:hypothetical protein [Palleronia sp.]|uniref:hypothetical protein n=1 Tax=Palleronia sp. TaxID=1940284 RepID=UPI0035C834C6